MTLNLAFLPDAVAGVIQNGMLERRLLKSMRPALMWRQLCVRERHPGGVGELITKTRSGLIQPDTEASARRTAGSDPGDVTRSIEQFTYSIAPYGKSKGIHLPSSFLAAENLFLDDMDALGFHAAQTTGRIARDRILAAYGGGDTFTTDNPSSTTSVAVKDGAGFEKVMVNGVPTPVSVTNPLPVSIGGTSRLVSACTFDSGSTGTAVLTITVALDYAKWDRVVRADAPTIVRQSGRATDHLIVAGDTPTIASFRQAAAYLRTHNVPGLNGAPGGLYGCFVDPHTENALFADDEFHRAIQGQGITGPFADGAIGDYAGIRFIRQTEMTTLAADSDYQTDIHRSLVFGQEVAVEAYIPPAEFQRQVIPEGIASANHYKMPLDPDGVLCMVVRAPMDKAGEIVTASWLADLDYCIPTDINSRTGAQRVKRAVVVHTAGPAA